MVIPCNKCGKSKQPSKMVPSKQLKRGYELRCKDCRNRNDRKRYTAECPKKKRNKDLRRLYGITLNEYSDQVAKRNGQCDICCVKHSLVVDHDHKTGKIRGYLCQLCNTSLGGFRDSITNLIRAHQYLKRATHGTTQ